MMETSVTNPLLNKSYVEPQRLLSPEQVQLLNDLRLEATLEVGLVTMTAEELLDLTPGQLFEFQFDSEAPLFLTVAGERIASAKLVAEGEGLAIEITNIFSHP